MIKKILKTSRKISNGRTRASVLAYLMEEVGELATEVNIKEGHSGKKEGKDGIIGEAVDVVLCAIDIMYVENPDITTSEIEAIMEKKLAKWLGKFPAKTAPILFRFSYHRHPRQVEHGEKGRSRQNQEKENKTKIGCKTKKYY